MAEVPEDLELAVPAARLPIADRLRALVGFVRGPLQPDVAALVGGQQRGAGLPALSSSRAPLPTRQGGGLQTLVNKTRENVR